jgi:DNA replication protein DnaC
MTSRYDQLQRVLRELKLPHMASGFADMAIRAARENLSPEAYLFELAKLELEQRMIQRTQRRTRESGLPAGKTFTTFQRNALSATLQSQIAGLRQSRFVQDARNVIAIGAPGTGKSHLLAALGHELIQEGTTVYWSSTALLVQRLLAAKRELRLPQALAKLDRYACLILDDIGYVQHERDEMEVLFTLLAERYERRSIMLSTNLAFSAWDRIFKDPMTTIAAIDRVVHHAVILDMMALKSYRAKEAHAQQQSQPAQPDIPSA